MKHLRFPVIATHITGWLLFQSLPLVFLLANSRSTGLLNVLSHYEYWQFCFYYVIVFYLHGYFLLPRLYAQKRKLLYFITMLLLVLSVLALQPFEKLMSGSRSSPGPGQGTENRMRQLPPPQDIKFGGPVRPQNEMRGGRGRGGAQIDIISIILFIMIITLSVAMDLTRRWRETTQRAAVAEADKANAELSFLKAQINPHFLFNTLNNIYSMAVTKNENTADTIMKLSNIMRYVTDDVNEDYVSLQSEVDCITDYIDLQKLRLGKKVSLEYKVTGDLDNKKITPLILMTFIENVFKYGTSNHEHSNLIIQLQTTEGRIDFFTQNPLFDIDRKIERTGIGIDNTRKRLEHLYPGKHKLEISKENGIFSVQLSLYS
ncbi:MAG: histidine kinase [Sediminibacterium sp.]